MKTVCMLFIALAQPPNSRAPLPDDDPVAWGAVGRLRNTPKLLRSASDPADLREPAPRPASEREAAGRRCRRRSLAASRSPSLGPRRSEVLRSCSEVAPGTIGRSAEAAGDKPRGPARAPALASGEVRQGPTEVRQGLSGHPSGARRRAKYRQVSPGAARAARPRGGGKTFAGRGHGHRGAAAPSQVSPSIARVPHLEDGTTAAPGRPLSSGSSHARSGAAGGCARRLARVNVAAGSLHRSRCAASVQGPAGGLPAAR